MDFSEEVTDEIFKIFQAESEEIIEKLNNGLLNLEKNPNNKEAILMLFRDAHTLKGASRMVGFTNVQTVAHKMEDVLGLAKDNEININSKIVDILYKTVDFLSDLIQKAIEKKQELYNEDIPKQIALLENIKEYTNSYEKKTDEIEFNAEILTQNIDRINNLISDCLFILMKIEIFQDEGLIKNLLSATQDLYAIFEQVNIFDLKKSIEDVKVKLEFTSKASNCLTNDEIEDLHKKFDEIINKLIPVCELNNLETIDYYFVAFEKMSAEQKEENHIEHFVETITTNDIQSEVETDIEPVLKENTIAPEKVQEKIEEEKNIDFQDLEYLQSKIEAISRNESSISEIINFMSNFEEQCTNANVKNIFQRIMRIFDFATDNEIPLDAETILVLKQSIEYCDNILKNKSDIADNELIIQRLEIIRQVLELNKNNNVEKYNFVPQSESRVKPKKITDFSEIFNTGEIKTLRVDSEKLDTLFNQVNELAITKIKSKQHLQELNVVNNELEEWQRNSIKALNFLKYYDKKYFQSFNADSPISFFIKQLINLFTDNNKKIQETLGNIENLYHIIQEDNAKIGLYVDNLEHMVKNVRVLPLATIFHLFGRMVRDIAREKGKQIELEIVGSETGTDKKIIEEIKAPLIHIIRNAIDHGIETPSQRAALGKKPTGKIILSAWQANNNVIIEIKDDGRGLNLEKIKAKAIQKGYLTQEEINSMTDKQITDIIFTPGFSTEDEITNLSGRGIGLDVVQTKIAQLNGKVKIISEVNKGCCIRIELPTAMSMVNAFLVKSSNQTFAIPMESINTVLRKNKDEIIINKNKKSIIFNEKTIPVYDLADILNLAKNERSTIKETLLILESDNKTIALSVDKLLGDQEILHKKLCAPLYKLKNISGITTLASGEICLILNVQDILKTVSTQKIKSLPTNANIKRPNNTFKILLVDDSLTTRTLEKNILEAAGYTIETAFNPLEALEKIRLVMFDLIISDIEMPEMDGFKFLEILKTDEMFSNIPIIMVSSLPNDGNKKRAMDMGALKYMTKNEFNQDDFVDSINNILHKDN